MAKKVMAVVKLQCPAGQANPAPPVGPALGQHGVNIGYAVARHFRSGRFELFGRAGHHAHAEDSRRLDFLTLGKIALDHRAHHLLRTLTGGKIVHEIGVKRLDISDPAG